MIATLREDSSLKRKPVNGVFVLNHLQSYQQAEVSQRGLPDDMQSSEY